MLKEKLPYIIPISLAIIIGGYFIYRKAKGKETYEKAVGGDKDEINQINQNNDTQTETNDCVKSKKYVVDTLVSNLNVREQPNTNSKIINKLKKGTEIFACPSSTNNWFQIYSEQKCCDEKPDGFVSADYIKEK